jgi:hypothetical protein
LARFFEGSKNRFRRPERADGKRANIVFEGREVNAYSGNKFNTFAYAVT